MSIEETCARLIPVLDAAKAIDKLLPENVDTAWQGVGGQYIPYPELLELHRAIAAVKATRQPVNAGSCGYCMDDACERCG